MIVIYEYRITEIVKVVDGDTYDLVLDLGFYQYGRYRIRLLGFDTPELNSKDPLERDQAKVAKIFAEDWLAQAVAGDLRISTEKSDSFGRFLGDIYEITSSGYSSGLGDALHEAGLAEVYTR